MDNNYYKINKIVDNPFLPIIQAKVLTLLKQGIIPWQQGFSPYGVARNYVDNRFIYGISWLLCNFTTNYPLPYYLQWQQIQALGGSVKKHTKAEFIYYQQQQLIKRFPIYNITCITGIQTPMPKVIAVTKATYTKIEDWLSPLMQQIPTKKTLSRLAEWNTVQEILKMPVTINPSPTYYWHLFKSLIAWTGSEMQGHRLSINKILWQYPTAFQKEQLIGELGAAFLCGYFKIYSPWKINEETTDLLDWYYYIYRYPEILIEAVWEMRQAVALLFDKRFSGK